MSGAITLDGCPTAISVNKNPLQRNIIRKASAAAGFFNDRITIKFMLIRFYN
jgi:hypothetical protein